MFKSSLKGALPNFATQGVGLPATQTYQQQPVDVNTVNPMFKNIYQSFNDSIADLQRSEQFSRQNADNNRQVILQNYDRGVTAADAGRTTEMDQARRSNQDFQTQNRIRARAIGGAPSSAFLDLSNRIDQQTQRDFSGINTRAVDAARGYESQTIEALNKLEADLNQTILQIESNRRLSLRERDQQIRAAEENAARSAMGLMQGAEQSNYSGGGNVLGANDTEIELNSPSILTTQFGQYNPQTTNRGTGAIAGTMQAPTTQVAPGRASLSIGQSAQQPYAQGNPYLSTGNTYGLRALPTNNIFTRQR